MNHNSPSALDPLMNACGACLYADDGVFYLINQIPINSFTTSAQLHITLTLRCYSNVLISAESHISNVCTWTGFKPFFLTMICRAHGSVDQAAYFCPHPIRVGSMVTEPDMNLTGILFLCSNLTQA